MKRFFFIVLVLMFFVGLSANADDLSLVSVNFCTGEVENSLSINIEPEQQTGLCYEVKNNSRNIVKIKIGFVDGAFTNDQWKNKSCRIDSQIENFGQYVSGYSQIIDLQPGQSKIENAILKYPIGSDGLYHGCLVYSVLDSQKLNLNNTNFAIQMRKSKFIDLLVGDISSLLNKQNILLEDFTKEDGENLSSNPKIRIHKDLLDDKYVVSLKLKNIAFADTDIVITGVVKNFLTHKEIFEISRTMTKNSQLLITQKLDKIPNYNLSLRLTLNYKTPLLDDKVVEGDIFEKTSLGIWNIITWITILILIVLGFVVYLLIKDIKMRNQKKISKKSK